MRRITMAVLACAALGSGGAAHAQSVDSAGTDQDALYETSREHMRAERHEQALAALERWFAAADTPDAEAWVMRAQLEYQLERWAEGAESIDAAIELARRAGRQPPEGWLQLAGVFAHERGGCERALDKLATLMRLYPRRDYYMQAAGCAGQLGDEQRQLALMDRAAAAGLLDAAQSLVHANILVEAERYADAQTAIERGARQLDAPTDSAMRADFERAAALIDAGRYDDARRALHEGLEAFHAASTASNRAP